MKQGFWKRFEKGIEETNWFEAIGKFYVCACVGFSTGFWIGLMLKATLLM